MLAAKWLKVWLGDSFNYTVLAVILAVLATGIVTSLIVGAKDKDGGVPFLNWRISSKGPAKGMNAADAE